MFSLELLRINLNVNSVLMLFVTSLTSYLTISALTGFSTDLSFTAYPDFEIHAIPMVILLGLFCVHTASTTPLLHHTWMPPIPVSEKSMDTQSIGGLMLGATLLMFPSCTDRLSDHNRRNQRASESLAKVLL